MRVAEHMAELPYALKEPHIARRNPVDVRCAKIAAAVAGQIAVTQVVRHKEHNPCGCGRSTATPGAAVRLRPPAARSAV